MVHAKVPSRTGVFEERNALLGPLPTAHSLSHDPDLASLFPEIISQSSAMQAILRNVYRMAASQSSVLILGESGTGKELISAAIHRLSLKRDRRFVAINCSAIPDNLLEAELFGHERGAFTGADKRRIGHFGAANGGTILLDEIGDMSLRLQAKLLRVLQEKKFTPIGSREPVEADIRIIAATNINLEEAVKRHSFRLDLYYRLNVLQISIPPLRERKEDIPLLLSHFLELSNRLHAVHSPAFFDEAAKEFLLRYDWPGNIRQLQNLVERLVILSGGGCLGVAQLPEEFHKCEERRSVEVAPTQSLHMPAALELMEDFAEVESKICDGFKMDHYLESIENSLILAALRKTQNNKNQAAQLLGLNRTTLVERIKKRRISI